MKYVIMLVLLVILGVIFLHCVRWRISENKRRARLTPEARSEEDLQSWFDSQF